MNVMRMESGMATMMMSVPRKIPEKQHDDDHRKDSAETCLLLQPGNGLPDITVTWSNVTDMFTFGGTPAAPEGLHEVCQPHLRCSPRELLDTHREPGFPLILITSVCSW